MTQDAFYQNIESEAWFNRNHPNFNPIKVRKNLSLRKAKESIYQLLLQEVNLDSLSVLEIGCSVADLLLVLRERHGCEPKGVEPSSSASQIAREFFDIDVEGKTFLNSGLFSVDNANRSQFDLVILDDVVGWMEPRFLLTSLGVLDWLLRDGGHIFIRELYSPHALRIKNHHYPSEEVYNYRYPGGVSNFFLHTGAYVAVSQRVYLERNLQKVSSSRANATWQDSVLKKSDVTVPTVPL